MATRSEQHRFYIVKAKLQVPTAEYRKLSDEELLHRFVHRNDHAPMHILFERYGHLVFGACFNYLKDADKAGNATRELFIRLFENAQDHQAQNVKDWLLEAAKTHCSEKKTGNMVPQTGSISDMDAHAFSNMQEEQLTRQIQTLIGRLSCERKICVELFYLQKLTYEEIAAQTGYSRRDVKMHLQKGLQDLTLNLKT